MDGHKQDLYDLWTGNTSLEEINNQALLKGKTLAHYIRKPIVPKSAIIPTIVIETIEPILQGAAEYSRRKAALREDHIDKQGQSHTLVGLAVESLKVASPSRISSVVEFILALAFAGWIIFLVKVFNIRAQHVVDTPRLTKEYSKVKELDS